MSEAVYFIEGLACPFYRCDVCSRRITDPHMAMVAWGEAGDHPEHLPVRHVHKRECLDTFEASLPKGHTLMTTELIEHMDMLRDNTFKAGER